MRIFSIIFIITSLFLSSCADSGDVNTRPFEQAAAPEATPPETQAPQEEQEPSSEEEPGFEAPLFEELPPQAYLPDVEAIDIALGVLVEGALLPTAEEPPPPTEDPIYRPRRRMDIDQLDQAVERVSGGICWTDGTGDCEDDDRLFVELASSLGKPDFRNSTQEDLSPSALFQKFLGDAARFVCNQMMVRELNNSASESILFQHVSSSDTLESNEVAVNTNISALIFRFHGRNIAPDSTRLELWRWLFQTSSIVANDPALGWRNVCVGLFSHPDFYSY
jgi:hypothetical protein